MNRIQLMNVFSDPMNRIQLMNVFSGPMNRLLRVETGAVHILESTIGTTYMVPAMEVSEIESLKKEFEGQIRSF